MLTEVQEGTEMSRKILGTAEGTVCVGMIPVAMRRTEMTESKTGSDVAVEGKEFQFDFKNNTLPQKLPSKSQAGWSNFVGDVGMERSAGRYDKYLNQCRQ
jgi:hypothetical protein